MKISKKDFAQLYKYIKNHCYWLPPQETLRQADWSNVLRDFKKAHRQGNVIPLPIWVDQWSLSKEKLAALHTLVQE